MTQQHVTESSEKTKHYVERRETESDAARSLQSGLPPVLQLQRTLGNRQVAELIQNGRIAPEGRIIALQRKLTVGAADDPYEQEANRMARQVMNTSDAQVKAVAEGVRSTEGIPHHKAQTKPLALSITPVAQQQKGNEHEVEETQGKESDELIQVIPLSESAALPLQRQIATEDEESDTLQAKSAGALNGSFDAGTDVETQVSLSKGRGSPLPDPVRAYMEPRFGVDFNHVRVHTGNESQRMNEAVGAQAFTHGNDIYFGAGHSPTHLELTAHELTHVVQQTGGRSLQSKKGCKDKVDNADSSLQTLPVVPEEGRIARKEPGSRGLANVLTSQLYSVGQQAIGTETELGATKPPSLSLNAPSSANLTGMDAKSRGQTVPALSGPLPAELKGAVLSAAIGKAEVAKPAVKAEVASQSKVEPPAQTQQLSQGTENIPAVAASPETTKESGEAGATATSKKSPAKPLTAPSGKAEKDSVSVKASTGSAESKSEAEELSAGAARKYMDRAPRTPAQDPDFQKAKLQVRTEAKKQKKGHATAGKKRDEAEMASALPSKEQENQSAKEINTEVMEKRSAEQKNAGKNFSAEEFKKELLSRINAKQPTTEGKAKEFAQKPPLEHFEEDLPKKVADEQGKFTSPLQEKATDEPGGGVAEKSEGNNVPDPVFPPAPKPVDPKLAIPKSKTDQEISLEKEGERMDVAMQKNRLSDEQLAESREPSFIETLKLKQEAKKKVSEAPAVYRQRESEILNGAETQTNESLSTKLQGMGKIHQKIAKTIHGGQKDTEAKTEKRQREIKEKIDGIYQGTVTGVKTILEGMAKKVKEDFANSLRQQTNLFNENVRSSISDYYGDWRIDDKLFGPDDVVVENGKTRPMTLEEKYGLVKTDRINPEVFEIFREEKDKFIVAMNVELDKIATDVQTGLNAAHAAIQLGKANIAIYKATLKGSELEYADGLELEVQLKFDNLESSIDDAREDLLQTLADQYNENVNQLETTFRDINDELKKSWIDRAVEFIETVGKTIFQLAELLFSILTRVVNLVWDIIKHPIRFFETLVTGLKQGIELFIQDIGTHLKEAFWTWIAGATPVQNISLSAASSGIESLFGLVVQVLRLGPADLRAIVEKVLGKEFMQMVDQGIAFAEKVIEPVTILVTQGIGPFWRYIQDTLGNVIQSTFDRIKESVFQAVIEKGLKWIAGFFIPGGGFVKIVKAIVSAFQFVAENLENIRQFFDSIFDSMEAAVEGRTEGVANKILSGIKKGMVLALDFLAKQLGLGKLVDSVQKIIQSLRRPIVNAIEWVLGKAKPYVMNLMKTGKALWEKGKAKVIGAGKAIVQVGLPEDPNERLTKGMAAGVAAINKVKGDKVPGTVAKAKLAGLRLRYGLPVLEPVAKSGRWYVHGEIQRAELPTDKKEGGKDDKKRQAEQERDAIEKLLKDLEYVKTNKDLEKKYGSIYRNAETNHAETRTLIDAGNYDAAVQRLTWARRSLDDLNKKPEIEARGVRQRAETLTHELAVIYNRVNGYANRLLDEMGGAPEHETDRATIETLRANLTREKSEQDKARTVLDKRSATKDSLEAAITKFGSIRSHFEDIERQIADIQQKVGIKLSKDTKPTQGRAWNPNETIEKQLAGTGQLAALERIPGGSLTPLDAKLVRGSTPAQLEELLEQLVRDGKITEERKDQLIHTIHKFFERRDLRHGK